LNANDSDNKVDYYCVKNPSSHDLKKGITWEQARAVEREFFSQTAPWSGLDSRYMKRLGTEKLVGRLATTLTELIAQRYAIISL
jgi:hypothetical protein